MRNFHCGIYYSGKPVSGTELECKKIIDYLHTNHPTWGARQMAAQLKLRGYRIGRKKARRWMTEMAIDPIYPKPNLSKCLQRAAMVPYLLRNADITRPNQAWSIDIRVIMSDSLNWIKNDEWFVSRLSILRMETAGIETIRAANIKKKGT